MDNRELYMRIRKLCDKHKLVLVSYYYGNSGLHMIKVRSDKDADVNIKMKQTGDSINFCLTSLLHRLEQELN